MSEEFADTLGLARRKLAPADRTGRPMATLAAAAFFAITALVFVATAVLAPPNEVTPAARTGVQ